MASTERGTNGGHPLREPTENIFYSTAELEKYFSQNRIRWNHFYESERVVIDKVWPGGDPAILDIGCGCGGLGLALRERFSANRYTGVEINFEAATSANRLNPQAKILSGDFLGLGLDIIAEESFDLVFSLSCIDWNLTFAEMLLKAWSTVKPGGVFIASFRLTTEAGINDINQSYQFINYDGHLEGEIAPYVVLNASDLMQTLLALRLVCEVFGYGYYGPPSKTAVTPFRQLCFVALAIRKSRTKENVKTELLLPEEISKSMLEVSAGACLQPAP